MAEPDLQRIIIVGGGVAGWMTAAALARALSRARHQIIIVETASADDGIGQFGPVEAGLPSLGLFHARLGLDEDVVLRRSGGSFTLGAAYSGWSSQAETYFAPFGDLGASLDNVPFHQLAARLRARGQRLRFADYSLPAMLAQLGRFARPKEDPRSVLSTYAYGLHLPLEGYRKQLAELAERHGVYRHEGVFSQAMLGAGGDIAAVRLDGGEQIEGDLFIDCSGVEAVLISGALGVSFESWRDWLPFDRTIGSRCDSPVPPSPYSHVVAGTSGWRRTVPAQGSVGECMFYSSNLLEPKDAELEFISGLVAPASADLCISTFESGRRSHLWHRNCVALGSAAAQLEPLEPVALHLVQSGVERLLRLFPHAGSSPVERQEYNRQRGEELDRLRDFVIARYATNGRQGEPLWDRLRNMPVPESLAYKIELYRSRGRVPLYDEEPFEEVEWTALFDAHGVRPRRYDARADAISDESLSRHLTRLREVMISAAASLPSHSDYIARHCASRAGESR